MVRFIDPEPQHNSSSTPYNSGPKVICVGLYRCGTSSLQTALETLGFRPCYHGAYLMPDVSRMKLVDACTHETDARKRRKMLATIFDQYPAAADVPCNVFADDLIEMYPDAKVVLNKRKSAEDWAESCGATVAFYDGVLYRLVGWWVPMCYWHHRLYKALAGAWRRRFGDAGGRLFERELYEMHNDWVGGLMKKRGRELLEWEVGRDGWESLCKYVGADVPKGKGGEVLPFPRSNDKKTMQQLEKHLVWMGIKAWSVRVGALAMAVALVGATIVTERTHATSWPGWTYYTKQVLQ